MLNKTRSLLIPLFLFNIVAVQILDAATISKDDPEDELMRRVIEKCIQAESRVTCFADRAAKALEKAMDLNVPLFDGVRLVRNNVLAPLPISQQRDLKSGMSRLLETVSNFMDLHTLSIDLTGTTTQSSILNNDNNPNEARDKNDGAFSYGTLGGGGNKKNKHLRREKKYMQYAFMVLLGIFGLTGPLVMKTLGIIAAKALIASKVALIIVGSVALKKIFEKDHESASVKVHTIEEDDHDRWYNTNKQSPYWAYEPQSKTMLS